MKDYQIYLAGGMQKFNKEDFAIGNAWREHCKSALENYECDYKVKAINPNIYFSFADKEPKYSSDAEVMRFDLHKVRNSDLIIVNFNDMWSLGTQSEIAIAYDRGVPVIGLDVDNQKLHPWQRCMCERIFDDIDEMIDYIEDFYLR